MNPPSSIPGPSQQLHGCEGDGCASPKDTWLHNVYRRGVRTRLCSSCILLSYRSYYCCSCFLLIPCASLWPSRESGNPFVARNAPIITCQVCHEAIAHLACLQPGNGVFVCPACSASAEGRPFTYTPASNTPLDELGARVLVVGAQLALVLLQRTAGMARAEAERLAQNAANLRRRANRALGVAMELDPEGPSWNVNVQPVAPSENRLELGEGSQTGVNAPSLVQQQRRAMPLPHLSAQNVGSGGVTPLAMADTEAERLARNAAASRRRAHRALGVAMERDTEEPSCNVNVHPVMPSKNRLELGEGSQKGVNVPPLDQQQRRAIPLPPLSAQTVGSGVVTQLAKAATEAEPLAQNAAASRRRAHRALGVTIELDTEGSSCNVNIQPVAPAENRVDLSEGSQARVNAPPLVQQLRRAMPPPPLSALTPGRWSVAQSAVGNTEAARDVSLPARPPKTLRLFGVTGAATAAVAEVSRPTPPTLQLFPDKASSSGTKPRTLQLFKDKMPDDEDM